MVGAAALGGPFSRGPALPGDGRPRGGRPYAERLPSRMHSRVYVACMTPQTSSRTNTGRTLISKIMLRIASASHSPRQNRVVIM